MSQKRAIITGFNGFTGKYVAAELVQSGYVVYGIGTIPCDFLGYFKVDLLDKARLAKVVQEVQPNVVVHLAAISFVGHGCADAFYQVNVIGTRNLLEALADHATNLDAILLPSSANVYGNAIEGVKTELSVLNPANDYAVSKVAMEYMSKPWLDRLPLFIVRPFNYTGVGQSEVFLLPKIIAHFRRRADSIELGNLNVWRDFTDVRAVARAYRLLIEICPVGKTINVCSGVTYSLSEVITMAEKITGHRLEVRVNTSFIRSNEVSRLSGDPSLLRSLIADWCSPPLEETLKWMAGSVSKDIGYRI